MCWKYLKAKKSRKYSPLLYQIYRLVLKLIPQIDLFHNNFSPSGTQPEHRKLADDL